MTPDIDVDTLTDTPSDRTRAAAMTDLIAEHIAAHGLPPSVHAMVAMTQAMTCAENAFHAALRGAAG